MDDLLVSKLNDTAVLGIDLSHWVVAMLMTFIFFGLMLLFRFILRKRIVFTLLLERHHQVMAWSTLPLRLVERTHSLVLLMLSIYYGFKWLPLPPPVPDILHTALIMAVLLQLGFFGNCVISIMVDGFTHGQESDSKKRYTDTIKAPLKVMLWGLLFVVGLDNLGINITALVTGLGIGGVAIALASQNVLGDFLAAIILIMDKPFMVGDVIQVDELQGTVAHIGLKTTRLIAPNGESLIFSNADLIKSRIRNLESVHFKQRNLKIGITRTITADQLDKVPQFIRDALSSIANVQLDQLLLEKVSNAATVFSLTYTIQDTNGSTFPEHQQTIVLAILHQLHHHKIGVVHVG